MSTGANCRFVEKAPAEWFYKLQRYPYGETEEHDTFGPFPTFRAAHDHLGRHHANPGGYFVEALPGCKHDLVVKLAYPYDSRTHSCDRCGTSLTAAPSGATVRVQKDDDEPERNVFGLPLGQTPPRGFGGLFGGRP